MLSAAVTALPGPERGNQMLVAAPESISDIALATIPDNVIGAGRVRYADSDPGRLDVASNLGADITDLRGEFPRRLGRAPIVIAGSLSVEGLHCAIRSTEAYGRIPVVTIHFAPQTPLPLLEMYTRGITFHTSRADSR